MSSAVLLRVVDPDVMTGFAVLPQRDARALRVTDHVILDNPTLTPMCADQSYLLGRRRRPLRRRLAHAKPADGDVIPPGLVGIEAGVAHIDLHQFLIWV